MTPRDFEAFSDLLTKALAYYRQNASEFTLEVWWAACQRYELEQVRRAITAHATDPERGAFAPKVADIVRILDGTATDRAQLAWGKVHEAMSAVGAYQDVVFDDPAIHAVVEDLGGWPKLCRGDLKDLGYVQHRFCESYRAYVGRGTFDYPRRLAGDRSPDSEYERFCLPPPKPALVGDPERARAVYQGGGSGKTRVSYQSLPPAGSAAALVLEVGGETPAVELGAPGRLNPLEASAGPGGPGGSGGSGSSGSSGSSGGPGSSGGSGGPSSSDSSDSPGSSDSSDSPGSPGSPGST